MVVYEIERYATEDGPGIRTVLFLKGCNLRCLWCQNPESQSEKPQVMYYQSQCVGCKKCVAACPEGAVHYKKDFGFISDHELCTLHGACVDACFYDARKILGRSYSVDQLVMEILKDRPYFQESGGGVTFSGGEPMLQAQEVAELARLLQQEGIHTAIETAGNVPWASFSLLLDTIDLFYIDLKHIDSKEHTRFCGSPIERILANITKLSAEKDAVIVRIPVIPQVNDSLSVMQAMFSFLAKETSIKSVELLPYHRLGMGKYQGLGYEYALKDAPNLTKEYCQSFAIFGQQMGLSVSVGAE